MIPLLTLQVVRLLLGLGKQGEIMDLGMRTGTDFAAIHRLGVVIAWIAAYIVAVALIGMPWASIGFSVVFGLSQSEALGWRRLWALIPALLMGILIFGLFETIMYVEWPTPLALEWLSVG